MGYINFIFLCTDVCPKMVIYHCNITGEFMYMDNFWFYKNSTRESGTNRYSKWTYKTPQKENQEPIDTANEHIKHQVFSLLQRNV